MSPAALGERGPTPAPGRVRLALSDFAVETLRLDAKGQDRLLVRDGFAGVADGSTPLDKANGAAVGPFAEAALAALARHRHHDLREQVVRSVLEVGGRHDTLTTPTCGVGFVQTRGRDLEVAGLADIMVVIHHRPGWPGGEFTVLRDDRVGTYDLATYAAIGRHLAAGRTFEEARRLVQPMLADQFANHRNREGGYWVFANDPAAADQMLHLRVPADTVQAVLICSDGFARLWDHFGVVATGVDLLRRAEAGGLAPMGEELRRIEREPGSLHAVPRTSRHDDATAILLRRH